MKNRRGEGEKKVLQKCRQRIEINQFGERGEREKKEKGHDDQVGRTEGVKDIRVQSRVKGGGFF